MSLSISAPRWQAYLAKWGYPETRLVALPTQLPSSVTQDVPVAKRAWTVVNDALKQAQQAQRGSDFATAGSELRRATEYALYAWCAIWGDETPYEEKNASKALTFLTQRIPEYDSAKGVPNRSAPPDVHRIGARFTTLRQLYALSQATHHAGERPIYTPIDIEYLLTSLIGYLRTLPEFWKEYTKPVATAQTNTNSTVP
jgi:hypothetical protein